MIPLLGKTTATRYRKGSPTVVDFRRQAGAETSITLDIALQPAPKRVLERMPEGYTGRQTIYGVTYETDVRGAYDATDADVLEVDGIRYQLVEVTTSPTFLGQPTSKHVLGVREQARTMPEPA